MEILEILTGDAFLTVLTVLCPVLGGGAGLALRKAVFYGRAIRQAVDTIEEVKEANHVIYDRVQADPNRQELAKVLSGGVKKIKSLTGLGDRH